MANLEETLKEYDVVTQPEDPRAPSTRNSPTTVDETDRKTEDAPPADSTSLGEKTTARKASSGSMLDGHQQELEQIPPAEIMCPRTNCTEKILFCVDLSSEMNETYFRSRVGDKMSALRETTKAIRMYIMNKHRINSSHEFGLVVYQENALWVRGFSKPKEILIVLDDLAHQQTGSAGDFDLATLFDTLKANLKLPEVAGDVRLVPPPYIVRVLFVYGRSQRLPLFTDKQIHHQLESSPYFFVDVLYVHEPPSEENKCEDIFTRLCELDHKGLSYILEAASLTRLFDCVAMLLAHPLQRPLQRQADYHIASTPPAEEQAV